MRILVNEFCGHAFQIELSRELARRGHEVLHLYFADNPTTPKGDVAPRADAPPGFSIEGIRIPVRFSKHSLWTRRRADIAYGKAVAARSQRFKSEVVISANMPLDAQKVLMASSRRQGARFVFWLQDVYSFAVRFVLRRKIGPLASVAGAYYERVERRLMRQSDAVVSISPDFARIALRWGVSKRRSATIENWAPLDEVVPTEKDNGWAREHGVSNRFCFMYCGTLGMKHRPELLLALARYLEQSAEARLLVIAEGAGAEWLRSQAGSIRPGVLTMLPFQPYERLSEVMGSADALIALLDAEAGAFAVPSKVLSYMCASRPLIVAAPRENHVAEVVERAHAGMVISPNSPEEFVNAARVLLENESLRREYALSTRAYAEKNFNISKIADRFLEVMAI